MKTAVLLDAGGIILDETEYENKNALLISNMLASKVNGYSEEQYWRDVEESIVRFTPSTRKYVFWKYYSDDISGFETIWKEFISAWKKIAPPLKLMDGIEDEIKSLHQDFKIVLAGQYGKNIIQLLGNVRLIDLFVNKKCSEDFNITKPDPRYIQQIAEAANLKCENCIMVGDRIDKDIIPAKQNGMGTVFVKTGIYKNQAPRTPDECPDIVLDDVRGLAKEIRKRWKIRNIG